MISARAKTIFGKPSVIRQAALRCYDDPYDPQENNQGYINLGIAENHLMWDLLQSIASKPKALSEEDIHYGPSYGRPKFRQAIAEFLNSRLKGNIDPEDLVVANGVTTILDMLAYTLCEEGDSIMVPIPYYPGFDIDFYGRAKVGVVPVDCRFSQNYRLSKGALEFAWQNSSTPIKALLLTNPGNPTGQIMTSEEIKIAIDFAEEKKIHLIVDEIYAFSRFASKTKYQSILEIIANSQNKKDTLMIHQIYGMSKDFTIAGFRAGFFHSPNQEVMKAMKELSYFDNIPSDSQVFMTEMLTDKEWLEHFLETNKNRLSSAFKLFYSLGKEMFDLHPSEAGVFAWVDLRRHLKNSSFESENALTLKIFNEAKVNIMPGSSFHCSEPGWFRITFAHPEEKIREAFSRLSKILK